MSADALPVDRSAAFLALHGGPSPLLLGNVWDVGSARVLAHLGFAALATTSAGHAAVLGRHDGQVTRDEALAHAAELASATDLPLNADLENGFAHDPDAVGETYRMAAGTGIAGCSIEDYDPANDAIYEVGLACERVVAAVAAAHAGPRRMVVTARCEHHIRGVDDLEATIGRLQSYQEAGADVLYAPGVTAAADIARIVSSVDRPLNVLALPGVPDIAELGRLGVVRVSVGSAFSLAAMGGLVDAAHELLDKGTYGFWQQAERGGVARQAFDV